MEEPIFVWAVKAHHNCCWTGSDVFAEDKTSIPNLVVSHKQGTVINK
jgi:hypothetical protein